MAGRVRVDDVPVTKAGAPVRDGQRIDVEADARFVSRGGEKLEVALDRLAWDVIGAEALDVGASTGGFTDCLLQRGAAHVVAVDVGRGQLHERLRVDPRVTSLERRNIRDLGPPDLPYAPDLLVADVSFISLRLALGPAVAVLRRPWRAVVLVKPQFEAGRGQVARGGVVHDREVRAAAVRDVARYALDLGARPLEAVDSEHPGPAGNREYLLALASPDHPVARDRTDADPELIARRAVGSLPPASGDG
jgi:23S rRNA (cytidine1920-2'-O)/16S rRNA (cytidine1409-2'-O)-methyltransferase